MNSRVMSCDALKDRGVRFRAILRALSLVVLANRLARLYVRLHLWQLELDRGRGYIMGTTGGTRISCV
ncbi:MAG: hypothetical protein GDA36_10115 [Rhodobacteraceae bacterium]|nr:hypothetical protein [Paracoccaceae bacterium]